MSTSAPLRLLRRLARVLWAGGGITQADLKPEPQLEALPRTPQGKVAWRSLGRNAGFTAEKYFAPGWVRISARLDSARPAASNFYFDAGHGFDSSEAVFMMDAAHAREAERFVKFSAPVRAIRFEPADVPLDFVLERFDVQPISGIRMWLSAFFLKLEDMRRRRNFSRSLRYGFKLLLNWNLAEFREKLFPPDSSSNQRRYETWRANHKLNAARCEEMRALAAAWPNSPLISVLMPVYNVPEIYLRKAFDSVLAQLYPRWELCVADDCSTEPHVRAVLDEFALKDARIKIVYREKNGHISAATNSCLELATGEFIATLDNDDEFAEHALFEVARALVADPALDFIYSDEDKIDMTGRHIEPFFKPDWSPEYLLACMYTCHLGTYRTALVRELGGWRSAFDSAQDYDLVLRLTEKTRCIKHIPDILYHWRMLPTSTAAGSEAKPKAHVTAQRALAAHLARTGENGRIEDGPSPGFHSARFEIRGKPLVSIIIASTCAAKIMDGKNVCLLDNCIASILEKSTWREFEIIVLDRNQMPPEMEARHQKLGVRRVSYSDSFNWSRVNNLGARHARGAHLLFLNDDMEVIAPAWLEALLEFSQREEIGAVGGKLLFPDGRLQHAGVVVKEGKPGHPYYCHPGDAPGYFCSNIVQRNCLAVTGACLMTRKEVFDSVGGFDEQFPLNYNDVDFCLKLIESGKRIVYTPRAQLYHFESVTRPKGFEPEELQRFEARWLKKFPDDPYSNPNLTFENSACVPKTD